jgi:hypothetical protein
LITAAIAVFSEGNGIAYSGGAYLVLVTTALLVVSSLILAVYRHKRRWLTIVLATLTFLGLVGTGLAAYFLEALLLIAFMALGLTGWLVYLLVDPADTDTLPSAAGRTA